MAVRGEKRVEQRPKPKEWVRVETRDVIALDDYVSDITGLGC